MKHICDLFSVKQTCISRSENLIPRIELKFGLIKLGKLLRFLVDLAFTYFIGSSRSSPIGMLSLFLYIYFIC